MGVFVTNVLRLNDKSRLPTERVGPQTESTAEGHANHMLIIWFLKRKHRKALRLRLRLLLSKRRKRWFLLKFQKSSIKSLFLEPGRSGRSTVLRLRSQ